MTTIGRDPWQDAHRAEAWAGEIRVNLLRMVALVLFYGRHLIEWALAGSDAPVRGRYHAAVTIIVLVWAIETAVLHFQLSRRHYPEALKYFSILFDGILVTLLCSVAGGPRTPLVLLYFALIASAPLRLSLRLVYVATAIAMAGYLMLLGFYAWYRIGFHRYYSTPELRIPRSEEAIYLLALFVCGLMAGQVVRQTRRMVLTQLSVAPAEEPA